MNIFSTAEFRVGALVTTVLVLIAVMSMQVSEDPGYLGDSKTIWFELKDAAGLLKNSSVISSLKSSSYSHYHSAWPLSGTMMIILASSLWEGMILRPT